MIKKHLILLSMVVYSMTTLAQSSNSHLLFQYYGIYENQSEFSYISQYLVNNNITMAGPDQEKAIIDAHNYYIAHKEEIDIKTKADELIQFRSAVKGAIADGWAKALSSVASIIPTAVAAGEKQREEYEKARNRDKEIQAFLAQHSSQTPYKQYNQNFGQSPVSTNETKRKRVTTSNGYDEPLPTVSSNNTTINNGGSNDRIIQAVYVLGNQLVTCRLRYNSGRIWAYSTSRNTLNQEEWISIQMPETPSPTMSIKDGDYAKNYKYTISGGGMIFYFNM